MDGLLQAHLQSTGGEAELVRRAKARDPAVWAEWHDQHYPFIYRYAYARLRNSADAEDVASQVFLEAIKGVDRYSYRGRPILSWFYGIASHLVARRFKEASRHVSLEQVEDNHAGHSNSEDEVVERLWLASLLARLKPEHRDVLILRRVMDLPTAEVARLLGKSEMATYSLQIRAVKALERLLREHGPDETTGR
jgi:RNA polymerase sigma-70 factor (ECF subfamily)